MSRLVSLLSVFTIIFIITACSSDSDTALYESAKANIQSEKFLDAMNDFQTILNDFPESKLTASVKFELGKMYQGNVIPKVSKDESIRKAIKLYDEIVNSFPDSIQAINSLFMIGFLEANELGNFEAARNAYEKFINKYPDHELALSAKAELMNLGKAPEEILQEKLKESE